MFGDSHLRTGSIGESYALTQYLKQGYHLVSKNYFNRKGKRLGEIDFIVGRSGRLVFVEVKTRKERSKVPLMETIDRFKLAKIHKAVRWFLSDNPRYGQLQPRIDVCLIEYAALDKSVKNFIIISNAVELPD